MTSPEAIPNKATAINKTWGKLCTTRYFFYEGNPSEAPISALENTHVVKNITSLEPISIALNRSDTTSWFLQVNDDMYVVYQRLQSLLANKGSNNPVYIGDKITSVSTGAFVLNHAAVAMMINRTKSVKTDPVSSSITNVLGMTNSSGFTADNPLSSTLDAPTVGT
jgi:hypothetical protein